jgi:hypothetical protein
VTLRPDKAASPPFSANSPAGSAGWQMLEERDGYSVTKLRRIGVIFAALTLSVVAVSPVLGVALQQDTPLYAADFQGSTDPGGECENYTTEGMILWHFILNNADSGDSSITLTATFENEAGDVITRTDSTPVEAGQSGTYHFEVETPDGYWLEGASTSGETDTEGQPASLVLSHACVGPPPPVIPEAPIALMLPLLALAVFGFYLLRNRRQSTFGA